MARSGTTFPSTLVLFGVTGDLAARKIIPSLWRLHQRGSLPQLWSCIGVSRRDWTDEQLRTYIKALLPTGSAVDKFLDHFFYHRADFGRLADYKKLTERLGLFDSGWRVCANKLFYLAVPPELYEPMLRHLHRSRLTSPCGPDEGWTRVIVEKPFGRDQSTSRRLEGLLNKLFREEQIYRIDHYLGKEILQNILTFRFANRIWQDSWSARSIERIDIKVWEKGLVEPGRADSYDSVGALKDVGQNHLLQIMALLTMDDPGSLNSDAVRQRRSELLANVKQIDLSRSWRAQYVGYQKLPGVKKRSQSETFFHLEASINHPDWRGVPITLESGKGLPTSLKEAVVTFRAPRSCYDAQGQCVKQVSSIVFHLEPSEGISISFWAKRPGVTAEVELKTFSWQIDSSADYSEPYERLLLDCFLGSQSLFVSTPEVRASWQLIDPVARYWDRHADLLSTYRPGTEPKSPLRLEPEEAASLAEIGFVGLGKMGAGLAEHLLDVGWRVVAWNRTISVAAAYAARGLLVAESLSELPGRLTARRKIVWLMLPAGRVVDDILFSKNGLAQQLSAGDIIIDGGNSHFVDTKRRARRLSRRGIEFVDVGVSGGPSGARWGAALMIGGSEVVVDYLLPLWQVLAHDGRSFAWVGQAGAGHYAKMVHNAIEYGMMQSLAEGAAIWQQGPYKYPLSNLLELYNQGSVIESRLVGFLSDGLRQVDGRLDRVDGRVAQSGEGRWAAREAERLGQSVPSLRAALNWRRRSQKHPNIVGQYLSLLRGMFGGHEWRKK